MVFGDNAAGTMRRFAAHVLRGRWFIFFASILIMAASGGTYIFGVYSKAIKTSLEYNQKTLNMLSFFKNVGASVGILPGLINEFTPPWVMLVCGAGMNLAGYLMIYLAVSGRTARPPVWLMCVYIGVGANSQTFANTGALVSTVKNFPDDRGLVLGLLTGFAGLSGAIFTELYRAFYGDNKGAELLLLMAWLPAAVSLLFVLTIRIIPRNAADGDRERKALVSFLYASMVPAVYLLITNVVELEVTSFPKPAYYVTAFVLLLVLLLPLGIVVKQELLTYMEADEQPTPRAKTSSASASLEPVATSKTLSSCFQNAFRAPARGEDHSILQALFSLDMLVLSMTTICGIGGMLTAVDNIRQIGQALGYPQRTISMLVSLVSLSNYAGRVVAGFGSDYALARYKVPRPLALTVLLVLAFLGHLLIALGVRNSLYAASVILGFCIGAQWTVLFAIISEVFGLRYFSTLYNLGIMASPVGSYVLNVLVTGRLYDREAQRQHGTSCIGVQCFKLSFLIIAVVTLLGAAVSLVLVWRTTEFYHGDLYGRFSLLSRRPTDGVSGTTDHSSNETADRC